MLFNLIHLAKTYRSRSVQVIPVSRSVAAQSINNQPKIGKILDDFQGLSLSLLSGCFACQLTIRVFTSVKGFALLKRLPSNQPRLLFIYSLLLSSRPVH